MQAKLIHKGNLSAAVEGARNRVRELVAERARLDGGLKEKESRIQGMKKRQNDKLAVFGEGMVRLHDAIQRNARRFKRMPVGPLGAAVSLRGGASRGQAAAVEGQLRKALRSFLVDNFEDRRVLAGLQISLGIR